MQTLRLTKCSLVKLQRRFIALTGACLLLLGALPLRAELKVTFSAAGDNTTPTGTITVNLGTTSATMSNLTGSGGLNAPVISGALAGLSGSFDINFEALGTVADNFDPNDFTGGAAAGIHSGAGTWAVNSDINALANTFPGQGIVFTFDFTNLVGATEIDLTGVRWNNSNDGSRLSFRDEGSGASTALYGGGGGTGTNQTITLSSPQVIDSDDQVAFFSGGGGQKRLAELIFNFVPAGITPPTGLTASTDGAQVDLDWDDDPSGTLDFYTVYRGDAEGGPYTAIAPSVATSDYTDTTVSTGSTYYYVVTATDNVGPTESGNSNEASIVVGIQPPTGLVRTQGDGVIDLDWADDTSGVLDFYTVYRSETSGGPYTELATSVATSDYSDSTVTNGTTYFYVVTATDNVVAQESGNSAEVSGTPYVPVAGGLYVRLDGSISSSITETDAVVSQWNDQTANGNNAVSEFGEVYYPSLSMSESGLDGLDMGYSTTGSSPRSLLSLFDPAGQDAWLDFADGAGALPYGGFAVLVAVHADQILGGSNRDVVMGSEPNTFSLRYENGRPRLFLGGSIIDGPAGVVQAGETVILAVNYDAGTGEVALWDSESGSTTTGTVPAGDFSVGSADFFLGGSVNPDQYMTGVLGEVQIYRGALDLATFEAERLALSFKWIGLQEPTGLAATSGDGTVSLTWNDQTADFYTVYRSETQGGPYSQVATNVLTTSYLDAAVTEGVPYYYTVTANESSAGESGFSAEVEIIPFTSIAGSSLYVHLDATSSGSVTESSGVVSVWADLTVNGNDALEVPNGAPPEGNISDTGDVLFPGSSLSASGLAGLDFGVDRNLLLLADPAAQDAWLDFSGSGAALPYSGFTVFIALKADSILGAAAPPQARDVVLANADNIGGEFVIRYQSGRPEMYLNGVAALQGGNRIVGGDTVVLAANYNAETGDLEFWDSASGTSANATIPRTDFSSGTRNMYLGGSWNPAQRMDGMIGEVKIYRGAMTPSEFSAERSALVTKWIGTTSIDFTTWINGIFANGTVTLKGPDEDDDGDGVSNLVEFAIEGEDPTVPNPQVGSFDGQTLTFNKRQTPEVSGISYSIEQSTDLGQLDDWEAVSATEDPTSISYTLPGTNSDDFLRLRVTQD